MCLQVVGLWLHESGVLAASPDGLITKPPQQQVHFQIVSLVNIFRNAYCSE